MIIYTRDVRMTKGELAILGCRGGCPGNAEQPAAPGEFNRFCYWDCPWSILWRPNITGEIPFMPEGGLADVGSNPAWPEPNWIESSDARSASDNPKPTNRAKGA